jgi:hypothetical protein
MSIARKLREQIESETSLERKIQLLTEAVTDSIELPHNIATTEHLKDLEIRMSRDINTRFDSITKEMNARFEAITKEMNTRFDAQTKWMVGLIMGLGIALHYWK